VKASTAVMLPQQARRGLSTRAVVVRTVTELPAAPVVAPPAAAQPSARQSVRSEALSLAPPAT
jgi:hypothetical protein